MMVDLLFARAKWVGAGSRGSLFRGSAGLGSSGNGLLGGLALLGGTASLGHFRSGAGFPVLGEPCDAFLHVFAPSAAARRAVGALVELAALAALFWGLVGSAGELLLLSGRLVLLVNGKAFGQPLTLKGARWGLSRGLSRGLSGRLSLTCRLRGRSLWGTGHLSG